MVACFTKFCAAKAGTTTRSRSGKSPVTNTRHVTGNPFRLKVVLRLRIKHRRELVQNVIDIKFGGNPRGEIDLVHTFEESAHEQRSRRVSYQ